MQTKWIEKNIEYDGTQLRSLYAYTEHGVLGDSIISWIGPCDVPLEHMVDGEDRLQGARICGEEMLHFLIEDFHTDLVKAVYQQRYFAALVKDCLERYLPESLFLKVDLDKNQARGLMREGDDLWMGDKKLSISIATVSPLSCLIHFALNTTTAGTPVPTLSLADLKVDPQKLAHEVMDLWKKEHLSVKEATCKVNWVK